MTDRYKLYGAEFSLYSGKVRAYLRKKAIPFIEVNSSIRVYKKFIVPRTGVKYIPVVQTPDDQVYQDTTVIIDSLEQRFPEPSIYPNTPVQKLVSLLLEVYGDEWLLIPAMHYRWHYKQENYQFIIGEFGKMLIPGWPGFMQRWLGKKVGSRFNGAVSMLGVSEGNREAIEQSYMQVLADLQTHFSEYDYLLGSCPSIADFGFIAPFYAHLYRDPYPGKLMRKHAPAVVAWVERMVSEEPIEGTFVSNDTVPKTLLPLLKRMLMEQIPVLMDTEKQLAAWKQQNPDTDIPRFIGKHKFTVEGVEGERVILPYSAWLFQRPRDYYQGLPEEQRATVDACFSEWGLIDILKISPQAPMKRVNNQLCFADKV